MGAILLSLVTPLFPLYPVLLALTLIGFVARPLVRRIEMDDTRRKILLRAISWAHGALLAFLALIVVAALWGIDRFQEKWSPVFRPKAV